MARITFWLNDSDNYASVEAEEFHEDGDFLKAYSEHNELVAIFDKKVIKGAFLTNPKKESDC